MTLIDLFTYQFLYLFVSLKKIDPPKLFYKYIKFYSL